MGARHALFLVTGLVIACGLGCRDGTALPSAAETDSGSNARQADQPAPDFAARLAAAKEISSSLARVEALANLATDAAQAGEGEVAKSAIEAMDSNNLARDNTAATVADLLSRAGKLPDAVAVAKLIGSDLARDQVLARLAKGQ